MQADMFYGKDLQVAMKYLMTLCLSRQKLAKTKQRTLPVKDSAVRIASRTVSVPKGGCVCRSLLA